MKYGRIVGLALASIALLLVLGQADTGARAASQPDKADLGLPAVGIEAQGITAGGVFTATNLNSSLYGGANGHGFNGVVGWGHGDYGSAGTVGTDDSNYGRGVVGVVLGDNSIGVAGSANQSGNGMPGSIGGEFRSYNLQPDSVGLHVVGKGTATGGFSTGGSYALMVKYDGDAPLRAGDVLALDGDNGAAADGSPVLGTVRATADNAGAAMGVAAHRYIVFPAPPAAKNKPDHQLLPLVDAPRLQVDESATSFQHGDLIEMVIAGQAKLRVSGNAKIGDRLALSSTGSITVAAGGDTDTIGKVASKPDKDGLTTVLVLFR